jgi:hypothetical protein
MKFSIRDLFLVTVIAAILTAWGIDHRRQAKQIEILRKPDYPGGGIPRRWMITNRPTLRHPPQIRLGYDAGAFMCAGG